MTNEYKFFEKLTDEQKLEYLEKAKKNEHYNKIQVKGVSIQPHDIIDAMTPYIDPKIKWYTDNIIKYALRFPFKEHSPLKDLEKIRDYADEAIKRLETPKLSDDKGDINYYVSIGKCLKLECSTIDEDLDASDIDDFHALDIKMIKRNDDYIGRLKADHFCIEIGYIEEELECTRVLVTANHKGIRHSELYYTEMNINEAIKRLK